MAAVPLIERLTRPVDEAAALRHAAAKAAAEEKAKASVKNSADQRHAAIQLAVDKASAIAAAKEAAKSAAAAATAAAASQKPWLPPSSINDLLSKMGGGKFSGINRPTAGVREEKAVPDGPADIQLYSLGTPNGQKVTILLEELGAECELSS